MLTLCVTLCYGYGSPQCMYAPCLWLQAFNASEEIAKAANYPHIRLFTAALKASSTPVDELLGIEQQWAVAGPSKASYYHSSTLDTMILSSNVFRCHYRSTLYSKVDSIHMQTSYIWTAYWRTFLDRNLFILSPTETVGGSPWGYFSATCWFFGRDIYDYVKYPIGLVDTDWGGTPVEAWSSPDALAKCFKQPQYVVSMSHCSMAN